MGQYSFSYHPMDDVWGNPPAPNELHAAVGQMLLAFLNSVLTKWGLL